ncbi:hypothetical protein EV701_101354 [Chthoniobacter flavus]|nr:hypothetical protein [Chthoniobacter flavus]TCO95665.1 hypothetical protein EV701_101354 [Chthoniobacter flavus]
MPRRLDRARNLILEWLRAPPRDPAFLAGQTDLEHRHEEIAQRFLTQARESGFESEIVKAGSGGATAYEVHWTHHGSSFVGFRQPPPEPSAEDALLAGCAALLENDWCRQRLPK